MNGVTVASVTTRWRLDPPARAARQHHRGLEVDVHIVERTTYPDGHNDDYWSVRGVPLTKKGNPNGGLDYRFITDEDMESIKARVLSD